MKTLNFRWGRGVLVKALNNLGCVWIGWKPISEINFRKIHAFGCHGKHYFPENDFRLTTNFTFDPEMNFSPHFHFNSLPEKEREREIERARACERRRSSPRSRAPAPVRRRDRRRDRDRAVDRDLAPSRSRIAIARRRSRSRIAIALSIAIQIAIAPSIAIQIAPWSRSCDVIVDDFFSWLWLLFCVFWFVFSFFFSKHQKIFSGKFFEMQPNTWKHFPFSEISISGKRFTATKHSLILIIGNIYREIEIRMLIKEHWQYHQSCLKLNHSSTNLLTFNFWLVYI